MTADSSVYESLTRGSALFALEVAVRGERSEIVFRNGPQTLPEIFRKLGRPGVAPILVKNDCALSGKELLARAGGFSVTLAKYGVTKGARVALALADDADFITAFVAVTSLGASAVLVPEHTLQSLAYARSAARCAWAITDIPQQPSLDLFELRSGPQAPLPEVGIVPENEALIAFTSGSTGHPKGAVITHRAVTTGLMNMMLAGAAAARSGIAAKPSRPITPVTLLRTSFEHVSGYMQLLAMMWIGGSILRSAEDEILKLIAQHNITSVIGISDLEMAQLLSAADIHPLRSISVVGRAMPAATRNALRCSKPGLGIGSGYGLTETCGLVAGIGNTALDTRSRAVGPVVPTIECRILADGREAPTGRSGQIALRGAALMQGYCNMSDGIVEGGWFQSDDIGFFSPDGCLHILDKEDRLIRAGHETLVCSDIEDMAREITGAREIAAVPHEAGLLVVGVDLRDSSALHDELVSRLPRSLSSRIHIRSAKSLPRTPSGKIAYARILECIS